MEKETMLCPKCGQEMKKNEYYCRNCGFKEIENDNLPFQKIDTSHKKVMVNFSNIIEDINDEDNHYADGLPEWSLLPPQIIIRKKGRGL